MKKLSLFVFLSATLVATVTNALPFSFTTGAPDGRSATGSRPDSPGKIEIESADDFILSSPTQLTSATFTGLLPSGVSLGSIGEVQLEIYRVFPNDSDIGRTPGAPTFSTVNVPTRRCFQNPEFAFRRRSELCRQPSQPDLYGGQLDSKRH
jgi:hypothetical protein